MSALDDLLVLQRIDTSLDQARHRRAHLPERDRLKQAQAAVKAMIGRVAALAAQRAEAENRQEHLEGSIGQLRSRISDLDKRAKVVSASKELQAIEHERSSAADRQRTLEDEELTIMEQLESFDRTAEELAAESAAADRESDAATIALAEAESLVDADIGRLTTDRDGAAAGIDPAMLKKYEAMRPKFGGVAVAQVEHGHCTGCRLQIPAGELDAIRTQAADALVTCEQCGRILVR